MLSLIIQAVVLVSIVGWLNGFSDAEFSDYLKAGVIALVAGLIGFGVTIGLAAVVPAVLAVILGLVASSLCIGFAIAIFYGVDVPRAMMGAGIFLVVNTVVSFALSAVFG